MKRIFSPQGQRAFVLTLCLVTAIYCAVGGLSGYAAAFAFLAGGWTSAFLRRVAISMGVMRGDEP
jgi:hypothetical protein